MSALIFMWFALCSSMYVSVFVVAKSDKYGGRESSTRCNFRKHMQIEMLQMLTTQPNKETHCKYSLILFAAFLFLVVL